MNNKGEGKKICFNYVQLLYREVKGISIYQGFQGQFCLQNIQSAAR